MVDTRQNKKKANGPKQTDKSRAKGPRKLEDYWSYVGSTHQARIMKTLLSSSLTTSRRLSSKEMTLPKRYER